MHLTHFGKCSYKFLRCRSQNPALETIHQQPLALLRFLWNRRCPVWIIFVTKLARPLVLHPHPSLIFCEDRSDLWNGYPLDNFIISCTLIRPSVFISLIFGCEFRREKKKCRLVQLNHTTNLAGPSFQCRCHCTSNYLPNSNRSSCHLLHVAVTKSCGFYRKVTHFMNTQFNGYKTVLIDHLSTYMTTHFFPFLRST